jgi:hypothetical protein
MKLAEMNDTPKNVYRANIQVGELNALNASLALIRYKQLIGVYRQDDSQINST